MKYLLKAFCAFFSILFLTPTQAIINVEVGKGRFAATPVAVLAFYNNKEKTFSYGRNISSLVAADLSRAGIVKVVAKSEQGAVCSKTPGKADFASWQAKGADNLLYGTIEKNANTITVNVYLYDTVAQRKLMAYSYSSNANNWRHLAHRIADAIYLRLTGEKGYFSTRIAYVAESGKFNKRVKRLSIMDFDGENHKFITTGRSLVMTPRFSPDNKKLIYFAIVNRRARVYIYNLVTGNHQLLGNFEGMSYAPRFTPDGKSVVFSIAKDMVSSIYKMDLATRKTVRITKKNAIDTSPCMEPNGRRIAFVSDREGTPQIFMMNANGSGVKRLSFGSGRYFTPVWSPKGDYIAFTKVLGGTFYVGVMRPDGSGERLLAQGYFVEGPTWAPNGKVIAYTRRSPPSARGKQGVARVYTIDVSGTNEREVVTPMDGTDPAWSALNRH